MGSGKRSKIEIIYDILKTISENKDIKKTHIIYKTNITHTRLKEYVDFLKEKDLLRTEKKKSGKKRYIVTEEGKEFMNEFRKLKNLTDAFGIPI